MLRRAGWLCSVLFLSACGMGKLPPRTFVPPPVRPAPEIDKSPPILPQPDILEAGGPALKPPVLPATMPQAPPPPPPAQARRPNPVAVSPKPPPAEIISPAPRLEQSFTQAELKENRQALDESLGRVKQALDAVARKRLTSQQTNTVSRIKTFQGQAQKAAREQDLVTAVSLAKRADQLARDLLQSLK